MVKMTELVTSEQQTPLSEKPRFQLGGLLFLLLVLAGLCFGIWQTRMWMKDAQVATVENIRLSGDWRFIDKAELVKAIRQQHPESFFSLDVQQVHDTLLQQPWVYQASVRKRWPKTLNVHVIEQKPTAFWNREWLLNNSGESFIAPRPSLALPNLFGPGGSEQTALQGYFAMQQLLQSVQLRIEELQLSERYAWDLTLNNGVKLRLGRNEFIDRLQRFVDLYPMLAKDQRKINYVDLRYDTGLAVGWKAVSNDKKLENMREMNNV